MFQNKVWLLRCNKNPASGRFICICLHALAVFPSDVAAWWAHHEANKPALHDPKLDTASGAQRKLANVMQWNANVTMWHYVTLCDTMCHMSRWTVFMCGSKLWASKEHEGTLAVLKFWPSAMLWHVWTAGVYTSPSGLPLDWRDQHCTSLQHCTCQGLSWWRWYHQSRWPWLLPANPTQHLPLKRWPGPKRDIFCGIL